MEGNYVTKQKDNRLAHNPEVVGSNPTPATTLLTESTYILALEQ
jgi:hypothetical protein